MNDQREQYFAKYEKEVTSLESKLEKADEKVDELEDETNRLTRQLNSQIQENANLSNGFENKMRNKENRIQELQHRVDKLLNSQKENMKQTNERSDTLIDELYQNISKLEVENKKLKRENMHGVQKTNNEMLSLQQRISLLEQENDDHQKRLSEYNKNNNQTLELITRNHAQEVDELNVRYSDDIQAKDRKIEELNSDISRLRKYYEVEIKSKRDDNKEISSEFTSKLQDYEKSVHIKDAKIKELEDRIDEIETENRDGRMKEFEELSKINETMKFRIVELENELNNASKKNKTETYRVSTDAQDKINQIKEAYDEEKKNLQKKIKEVKESNNEYEEKISQLVSEHEEEVGELQDQINDILEEKQKNIEDLTLKLELEQQQVVSLENELSDARNKLDSTQLKNSDELTKLHQKIGEINKEMSIQEENLKERDEII